MQRAFLAIVVSALLCGAAVAQQVTGPAAEDATKQLLQIEKGKIPLLLSGGDAAADWLYTMDAEDALFIGTNYRRSKAEVVAMWRAGNITQFVHDEHGYKVYIYDNGNLGVVTYTVDIAETVNGRSYRSTKGCEDSWVKKDGKWLRVVHFTAVVPAHGPGSSAD